MPNRDGEISEQRGQSVVCLLTPGHPSCLLLRRSFIFSVLLSWIWASKILYTVAEDVFKTGGLHVLQPMKWKPALPVAKRSFARME